MTDKQIGIEMLNWLKGPSPLSNQEISFIDDRFRDGKWFLWEQFLLVGIRMQKGSDSWALILYISLVGIYHHIML